RITRSPSMSKPLATIRVRRVLETALDCENLPRSAAFYSRLLGMAPMVESDRLVALDAGTGTVLLLFQRGGSSAVDTPGGPVPGHGTTGESHLAFAIDASELESWDCRLSELGIAVESRVRWPCGGTSVYFRDPDGHSVELATPGIWPNY